MPQRDYDGPEPMPEGEFHSEPDVWERDGDDTPPTCGKKAKPMEPDSRQDFHGEPEPNPDWEKRVWGN